jgi:tetratricopeptide (TPR) repeat protein
MNTPKIFFSYSREDASDFTIRLANDLREAGADVWLDKLDIKPSQRWDTEIQRSLAAAECILFVVSEKGVQSDNVLDEVNYGLINKKRVIPLLISECDIPYRVSRLQHISFISSYASGLKELSEAIHFDQESVNNAKLIKTRTLRLEGKEQFEKGSYKESLAKYTEAIKTDPDDHFNWHCRGNIYFFLNQYGDAIDDYNKAISLNPYAEDSFINRGRSYNKLDRLEEAYRDFSKAIELKTQDSYVYSYRAGVALAMENYAGTIADSTKAISLNTDLGSAYCNRGTAYHDMGNLEAALADFNKAVELQPDEYAYFNRGNCRYMLGDKRGGCEDFKMACSLGAKMGCDQYNKLCR